MALPHSVELVEVGPREGFQFEGIADPDRIPTADKIRLINALGTTGVRTIEIASFVSPKRVPQMADAQEICAGVTPRPGLRYTALWLNDVGLKRALEAPNITVTGYLILCASESFSIRNQNRNRQQDAAMQRSIAAQYKAHGIPVDSANIAAAFGCNYDGVVPLDRVLAVVAELHEIAAEVGSVMRQVTLADTMGWADPEQIRRTVGAVRSRWPDLEVSLHLHDTRGLGMANVYAGLLEGVRRFDVAVAGLGGCPFAGHKGAAGNVTAEEVVFLCRQLGIDTGVDLEALVDCAQLAAAIVGHPVPSKLAGGVPRRSA
jgi:hydroxymethylglutaryl-CoA lyase